MIVFDIQDKDKNNITYYYIKNKIKKGANSYKIKVAKIQRGQR